MNYLSEAFKKLDVLDEDVFDVDAKGLRDFEEFKDNDDTDDVITIVDPEAESEEDLSDSYIGKVILDCSVCHTDIYKDKSEVVIDEEQGLANVGEECPYCFSIDGFKVIGEVKPFSETEVETDDDVEVKVDGKKVSADDDEDDDEDDEDMNESLENVKLDTGDQEIEITAHDKEPTLGGDEMIAPLDDDTAAEIASNDDEDSEKDSDEVDVDLDDFSEEEFDNLGESYLKKVYNNVDGYQTVKASSNGNSLKLEGLIKFKSGKTKKTSFVFESSTITKSGKAKFIGENAQISRGKKSFTLTGSLKNNKFIAESLNYNYRAKDAGSDKSTRVYGTVINKK